MANENARIDNNSRNTITALANDNSGDILNCRINPITGALVVEAHVTSSNTSIGSTIPGGTQGSILFLGPGSTLAEDNPNLFYDDLNNFVGLGTNTPLATLHVVGSVEFDLGGDATGDTYYRDSSGFFVALPRGIDGTILTMVAGLPSWQNNTGAGYDQIQDNAVNVTQRQILNFVNFFTVTDNPGNSSTDVDINVSELATDTTFIDDLIANNYFTTNLANNTNFITTLTSNTTFISDIVNIVNNDPTIQIDLTTQVTGILPVPNGGTGANTLTGVLVGNGTSAITGVAIAQGDLFYGSATGVLSALAKDTNATRYLANTGTTNNPKWDQINLANGVTGTLPLANGGTGASLSDPGYNAILGWDDTDNSNSFWHVGSGLSYDHPTHTLSSTGGGPSVTSIVMLDDFLGGGGNDFTFANSSGDTGLGGIGELGWAGIALVTGGGDAGSVGPASGESGRPGIIQITSSGGGMPIGVKMSGGGFNGANPVIPVGFGNTSMGPLNQGNWSVATSAKLGQTHIVTAEIGFGGDTTLTGYNNGIYFQYTGGAWEGVCKSSGSTSVTGSTVAGDTNWHKFEIVMNGAGTSVEFFIDGSSLGTVASNIPSAADVPFDYTISGPFANGDLIKVDYWLFNMTVASR